MAISSSTFNNLGGAVSDLFNSSFAAKGLQIKAQGELAESQEYGLARDLAKQNEQFTETSTAIKEMQQQRELTQSLGETRADVASSGFAESGSALDILRDSAAQGALQHQVLQEQGLITEAGYEEQAKSYDIMSTTAASIAAQEQDLAAKEKTAGFISAGFKVAAAITGLASFGGGGGDASGGDPSGGG